jgi:hypothetical protein
MSEAPTNVSVPPSGKKFKDMTGGEKLAFIGKSIIFVLTSGFAFPRIWSD